MKFIRDSKGRYYNTDFTEKIYIEGGLVTWKLVAVFGGEQITIDTYDNREDAERALENLVRSLED